MTHSPSFRQRETALVAGCWRAAASCALIGVGSVGKSNLLQHLADLTVQAQYMGEAAATGRFKAIVIDPSLLSPLPAGADEPLRFWAGCELIMHRLFMAYYPFDLLDARDARTFYDAYQSFQDGANPLYAYLGLRYLEFGLTLFMRRGAQIVLMFDEFETLARAMPFSFFAALRGLRDQYKRQLSFVTFSRAPLTDVFVALAPESPSAVETFVELFTDRTIYLGVYSEADARQMLDRVMERKGKTYDTAAQNFILWAAGGHAGLLRAAVQVMDLATQRAGKDVPREALLRALGERQPVRAECETILRSLSEDERDLLSTLAHGQTNVRLDDSQTRAAFDLLLRKGLLRVESGTAGDQLVVQPPLLAQYLALA